MTLGFIYKAYHQSNPDVFYIGSTKTQLIKRLQEHKSHAKNKTSEKSKWLEYLRQYNYENFRIVLVDTIDYNHKSQLRELEDRYIKEMKPQLNTFGAVLDKERRDEKQKQYNRSEKGKQSNERYNRKHKYKCELCNFASARESDFNRHLSSVKHRQAIEELVDEGGYMEYTGFTEEEVLQFHETVEEVADE